MFLQYFSEGYGIYVPVRDFGFVCFDSLRPSKQSFSHARMGLPGLNQY